MGLGEGLAAVELSGGSMLVQDLNGRGMAEDPVTSLRVLRSDGAVEWRGRRVARIRVVPARAAPLRFQQRLYPGVIEVVGAPEGLIVVNELPMEEYLVGAVKAEAGDKMPIEMLKAQAIVARTYAAYHRRLNAAKPYHIVAGTANQQYAGRVNADSPAWTAVLDTEGQVLLWEGDLFPAFYHSDSGGHTEDPRVVFAAANMPALQPVRVEFPSRSPHHAWSRDVVLGDLAAALKRGGVSVGSITGLRVLERSVSLRVSRISVLGTHGSATLRGNEFRRLVGYDTLKSTLFAVSVDESYARFAGRGYGHGVGLDQWSAKTMADQGYTARQIVQYYYPGATLSSLTGISSLK
ncbi:MAG: SpoIID/LytB domain-containing protein [Candidatus Rokubacteria bacterium]|nr:SpoIID/LytB domain-containing protein [Candidatus Rokubacteria bacterium]